MVDQCTPFPAATNFLTLFKGNKTHAGGEMNFSIFCKV